jgi:hypothetical protein
VHDGAAGAIWAYVVQVHAAAVNVVDVEDDVAVSELEVELVVEALPELSLKLAVELVVELVDETSLELVVDIVIGELVVVVIESIVELVDDIAEVAVVTEDAEKRQYEHFMKGDEEITSNTYCLIW